MDSTMLRPALPSRSMDLFSSAWRFAGFTAPVPLIGFYSGVEIAPVNGRSRSLDWTAVLTVGSTRIGQAKFRIT